jgi:hypothetical protein
MSKIEELENRISEFRNENCSDYFPTPAMGFEYSPGEFLINAKVNQFIRELLTLIEELKND